MAGWGVRAKSVQFNAAFSEEFRTVQQLILEEVAEIVFISLKKQVASGETAFPLSGLTQALREKEGEGGTRPRVASGDFLRALQKDVEEGKATIGILVPRGSKGQDLEMIARIMEGGATIPVTNRMRKWFAAQGMPLKSTTAALKIPPRPIFNPVLGEVDSIVDSVLDKYFDRVIEVL